MTTKRTRRSTRKPVESQTDALAQALQSGALSFLSHVDMVRVLNTCRALRFDRELPYLGLANTSIGVHLLRGCCVDWMSARPSYFQIPELLDERQCSEHAQASDESAVDGVQRFFQEFDPMLDARRGQGVALLAALAVVQHRIVPLCDSNHEINRYNDYCTLRPVLCALPLGLKHRDVGYEITSTDVETALDTVLDGIGADFVATAQVYNHVSDFGAHWETIEARGKKTKCGFCDAAKQAIKAYRKEARAALKQFNDVLKDKKREWKADGCDAEEIHERRSMLKAEMFPEDFYPDVNCAEGQDDAILADICESSKFPMDPFDGMAAGFDRFDDDAFNALREELVSLCGTVYQPLKNILTEECGALVGRRVFRTWMGDGDGRVKGELVAGVTRSGFLVGVYLVTRLVD